MIIIYLHAAAYSGEYLALAQAYHYFDVMSESFSD